MCVRERDGVTDCLVGSGVGRRSCASVSWREGNGIARGSVIRGKVGIGLGLDRQGSLQVV